MTIVKKLSTKSVFGKVEFSPEIPVGGKIHLYTVAGICSGYRMGNSNFGDYIQFYGEFVAWTTNPKSDRVQSAKLFVPSPFDEMLKNAVDSANGKPQVEFRVRIGAEKVLKRDGSMGYEYFVESEHKIQPSDALSRLLGESPTPPPKQLVQQNVEVAAKKK